MEKIKSIRVKEDNVNLGTIYSLGADAKNIDVNVDNNQDNLQNVINNIYSKLSNITGDIEWNS